MSQTLAALAADGVLKNEYLDPTREQLSNELSPLAGQIESGSKNIMNGQLVFEIETGRSSATGSIGELDDLPTPSRQKTTTGLTGIKYHYGAVQFTAQTMKLATASTAVFSSKIDREMNKIVEDLKQDRQRQIWNDADAAICYASGAAVGQVIPVVGITKAQIRALVIDMELDIGTSGAGDSVADGLLLTAIDRTAGAETITVTGTIGTVLNGSVIRKGGSFGNELIGLQSIVSSGDSLYGIDGAVENVWNSYVDTAGGPRPLTPNMIQTALDEMSDESNSEPDVGVTTKAIMRAYAATVDGDQRFNDTLDLKSGYTGLAVHSGDTSIGLISDRFSPDGKVHLLTTSDLYFNQVNDWEWDDEDGSILRRIGNKHAWRADIFKFDELTSDCRQGHGVLEAISS